MDKMVGIVLDVEGRWAHFKRPETNNNPLTHDFITKTALIGMIGAVSGIDRERMRPVFPNLSKDLLYGVEVRNEVVKVSWGFTMWTVGGTSKGETKRRPKRMEFIRAPQYRVAIALAGERSADLFQRFVRSVQSESALYTPVLGLHNCPAILRSDGLSRGTFERRNGKCETAAFIALSKQSPISLAKARYFRVGFDRVPTFQNEHFENPQDKYERVAYPSAGNRIAVAGEHFEFTDGSEWALI